ncbi:TonB-dependent receptor [Montanilutibacter psychrotolerans]|uniref:TonB-dependent receptor n=1 Tax=Montanilutibacter psychrotolerans TaxID=1327343 RepID=A0A3M8SP59_9GAMM|nr:TonB-dependent receptor [Lysobacter psychrotolerans]RNF82553.1 TonB-dependent receptor [Lysobacter psychrotolerans]
MPNSSGATPRASRVAVAVAAALVPLCPAVAAGPPAAAPAVAAHATDITHVDDAHETALLDAVEVRATHVERREQRLRRAQHDGAAAVIDQRRVEQANIVGSEDLLRLAPNLTLRSRYIGDRNALIGGRSNSTATGSRALVYVDGLLISDLLGATFNPPRWGMVNPAEIASMDVLYGPFSAELPGNSMGTTVQITTRYPRAMAATAEAQWFSQSYRDDYGLDDDFRGHRLGATLGQGRAGWRWFVAASALDTHSQPMGYATPSAYLDDAATLPPVHGAIGDIDPDGRARVILGATGIEHTRQSNFKAKVGVDLGDAATLELVLGHWRNDYDRRAISLLRDASGAPVYAGRWRLPDGRGIRIGDATFSPQRGSERHRQAALSVTWQLDPAWSLQAIASDYRIADNTLRNAVLPPDIAAAGGAGTVSHGDGTGWNTLDLKLDGQLGAHRVRVGLHGDHYALRQQVFATDDWRDGDAVRRSSVFGGKARTLAAYVQDHWRFASAWELGVGARFERWRAFDGVRGSAATTLHYPQRAISAWSPKLSLARELGMDWSVRMSAGKAVRFPTVSELFQGTVSGNTIVNADPHLRPEVAYARELSLLGHVGDGQVRISAFEDDIRDSLFTQLNLSVTPTVSTIQNVGRVRNRGLEFAGEWQRLGIEGLELSASLAFNRSRILANPGFPTSEGRHAPRIPRQRAAAMLSYRPDDVWRFSLAGRYSGRQWNNLDNSDRHPDTFGGTSRFTVFDVKLTRRLAPGLSLGLGIDNVGDRRAFVFHPYPRRTLLLELRYSGSAP